MSLLQALGLGIGAPYNFQSGQCVPRPIWDYQQMIAQYQPLHTCIHSNCPICQKEYESRAKQIKDEADATAHRKELYEERCKDYMTKFRKKYRKAQQALRNLISAME